MRKCCETVIANGFLIVALHITQYTMRRPERMYECAHHCVRKEVEYSEQNITLKNFSLPCVLRENDYYDSAFNFAFKRLLMRAALLGWISFLVAARSVSVDTALKDSVAVALFAPCTAFKTFLIAVRMADF